MDGGRGRSDRPRTAFDAAQARRPCDLRRLGPPGIRPVVELLLAPPRRDPPDVRPLLIRPLELLLDRVLVVPVVLFRDPEVDQRSVPEIGETHRRRSLRGAPEILRRVYA